MINFIFQNKQKIKFINGEIKNKKITFIEDIVTKDKYYGIGYDIHQMVKGNSLYIAGSKYPRNFEAWGIAMVIACYML